MKAPHKLDAGKRRLRKFVEKSTPETPRLPLIHNTDAYCLTDIMDSGTLSPSPCDHYKGESLTYLFYGRPSFRPNFDEEPLALSHYFPICLIFSPDLPNEIRRVLPFDSGAFPVGLYKAYLHKNMNVGDFLLEASSVAPGKIISTFFNGNAAYLRGQPKPEIDADPSEFEVHALGAIYNAKESNSIDSRNSSIEIQFDTKIDLYAHLEAVILPEAFNATEIGDRLRSKSIAVLPYPVIGRSKPTEYMGSIHSALFAYLTSPK